MAIGDPQRAYWDSVAQTKNFSHPLRLDLFDGRFAASQRILDLGCGYGRVAAQIAAAGYRNVIGVDTSREMIRRGLREHPELDLQPVEGFPLPFRDASFGGVLLFSVLTGIPRDEDQVALLQEVHRLLEADGILYISDLLLQEDRRNLDRYARFAARFGRFGVFELSDGGVMRHHDPAWIRHLTAGFREAHWIEVDVTTMNGNTARAFQYVGRKV